jgi:SAM-dependent methyltransferase
MNQEKIREMAASFQRSRIILTGTELDIFTNIDKRGNTSLQVANKLQLNERSCERLLNALTSLGLLTKRESLFFNTEESFTFLSRNSADYSGGILHLNHLWNTWSHLTNVVRTGISAQPEEVNDRGEKWLFPFINAMHDRAKKQAPYQLADIDLSEIESVLDVGGGSGAYSMEFVSRKNGIQATVFDLPNVVPITKQFIAREGFSDKIQIVTGDYVTDDLPGGFDMVFLSAIIHSNSMEVNQGLITKCYGSLNKNGKIIIQDWIMNDDRTSPIGGAIFAINMLVGTEGGDCFTEKEVSGMLDRAGFTRIRRREFNSGLSQMTAEKL